MMPVCTESLQSPVQFEDAHLQVKLVVTHTNCTSATHTQIQYTVWPLVHCSGVFILGPINAYANNRVTHILYYYIGDSRLPANACTLHTHSQHMEWHRVRPQFVSSGPWKNDALAKPRMRYRIKLNAHIAERHITDAMCASTLQAGLYTHTHATLANKMRMRGVYRRDDDTIHILT